MDLVVIVVLLAIVVFAFRTFSSFVYFMEIIDIFFRVMHLISLNLGIREFSNFVSAYIPSSIPAVFAKYSSGVFYTILIWGYIIITIVFLVYITKTFFKKK